MSKKIIQTDQAPVAIGTYSQAVKHGDTLYVSGQIPLVAASMEMVSEDVEAQIHQVFKNLSAIAEAADTDLNHILKLNIFLTDLSCFPSVNEIMATYFEKPYPARAAIGVRALPKGAQVEMDAIIGLD
ncbi:MAG: RidA family protein [Enterobacterales bacterium]|nr:RidA family protein [Enterobacterales bacterium]